MRGKLVKFLYAKIIPYKQRLNSNINGLPHCGMGLLLNQLNLKRIIFFVRKKQIKSLEFA